CASFHPGDSVGARRFEIGLIGDFPYSAEEEKQAANLMDDINNADLAFVVHNGDFKAGSKRGILVCSDEVFQKRLASYQASAHPFIYLPGDNEWTDCHGAVNGSYDPLERLAKLRELFFDGNRSLGRRTIALARQSDDPGYAKFRENMYWVRSDVLFVGLHMVGSNDNLGRTPESDTEYHERNAATLAWLKQAFTLAKDKSYKGIMLITQANPRFEDNHWTEETRNDLRMMEPDASKSSGYRDFVDVLRTEVMAFDKPVVLVHGDSHYFRIDKPLYHNDGKHALENFTRVETFATPNIHWLRAVIDQNDPQVFQFKQEIVKKNRMTLR
ncbi:MAG TPA: hypothetical protein VGL10_04615, partial [Gammaproteobacteria bacterium]